jgi:hypothetical protein
MKMAHHAVFGILADHALFGVDVRRDPARERLGPLLSDATARRRRVRRLAPAVRLPRRARQAREASA